MALNIKDPETERLTAEVAALTGETKTSAIRTALAERRERLIVRAGQLSRRERLDRFLTHEAWPQIPDAVRGKPLTRQEREAILGYGPEGA